MNPRYVSIGAALLLICSLMLSGVAPGVSSAAAQESCSEVTVDAFRVSNSTIAELNKTGSATVREQNVRVTVEETESFVRVRTHNPNGYCTRVSVEISREIVSPAELGEVDAAAPEGSNISAEWSAMHSLADDELYTDVTYRAPAGVEGLLFAPSQLRVRSLSWTGEAERDANTTLSTLRELIGAKEDLDKSEYEFAPNSSGDTITVSLSSSDGRQVEEWHALYKTESGEWAPVEQETAAPVFYTEREGENMVKFHFNNQTKVKFTANPGIREKASYQMESYQSSIRRILGGILE